MRQLIRLFPVHLRESLEKCGIFDMQPEEIRVRVNREIMFRTASGDFFLRGSALQKEPGAGCYHMSREDLTQMCNYISRYSLYACEEEIRQGFLTVEGGHRVGVCGQVSAEGGRIRRIAPILYLNIRIASERKGCAAKLLPLLYENGCFQNTLLCSPPGAGKTTLLRDLVRLLSDGTNGCPGKRVGLVDERSEIAGGLRGVPQNDVGLRTDVLDGCPKAEGMMLLVRSMSPEILAVDEIGGADDLAALRLAATCGCGLLATAHAGGLEELAGKPGWAEILPYFSRLVEIRNVRGKRTWKVFSTSGCLLGTDNEHV